jgi:hypothetical protein
LWSFYSVLTSIHRQLKGRVHLRSTNYIPKKGDALIAFYDKTVGL